MQIMHIKDGKGFNMLKFEQLERADERKREI